MEILNIDTSILRNSVAVAEQANEAITEAASLLKGITVHEDWVCTERDRIKEMTLVNKEKAHEIQNHGAAFYSAVKAASERFDTTEQENCQRLNSIDNLIGKISTVVPPISEIAHGGSGTAADIDIINFEDFSSAFNSASEE